MDDVRWGFLGAGAIATRALAPAVAAAGGATLHAVAARGGGRAEALAGVHAVPRVHTGADAYAALLTDPDVEAVYLSLPNDLHRPWVEAALAAGKHVLCEKPLGLTAAEVAAMADAATAAGRLLVEAAFNRWHPRTRRAEQLVAEGAIGRVRLVSAGFTFDGVTEGNYRLRAEHGGGALYDVGCYALAAALWAYAGRSPDEVTARQVLGPTGVDLTTEVICDFPGGEAQVRASMAEPAAEWLVVSGDAGEIELRGRPYSASQVETHLLVSRGRDTEVVTFPGCDPYRLMVEAFSARVRGDAGAWVLPLAESARVAALADACFAAARTATLER